MQFILFNIASIERYQWSNKKTNKLITNPRDTCQFVKYHRYNGERRKNKIKITEYNGIVDFSPFICLSGSALPFRGNDVFFMRISSRRVFFYFFRPPKPISSTDRHDRVDARRFTEVLGIQRELYSSQKKIEELPVSRVSESSTLRRRLTGGWGVCGPNPLSQANGPS